MLDAAIECDEPARGQIERAPQRPHLYVAADQEDRQATLRAMTSNAAVRLERGENDAKIVVLRQRLRILAVLPFGLGAQFNLLSL